MRGQLLQKTNTDRRIYADEDERKAIEKCHERCLEVLEGFVESVGLTDFIRGIDVAGGDGRMLSSKLYKKFKKMDLFD